MFTATVASVGCPLGTRVQLLVKCATTSSMRAVAIDVGSAGQEVLLIDEPSIGLSPLVVHDVFRLLRKLAKEGTTILMVEQNVKSALQISDDAIALESGRLVLHKPASELLSDPHIERLFLGGAHAATPAAGVA